MLNQDKTARPIDALGCGRSWDLLDRVWTRTPPVRAVNRAVPDKGAHMRLVSILATHFRRKQLSEKRPAPRRFRRLFVEQFEARRVLNNGPYAADDSYAVYANTSLSVIATGGLLSNDSDPNSGDVLQVASINGSQAG